MGEGGHICEGMMAYVGWDKGHVWEGFWMEHISGRRYAYLVGKENISERGMEDISPNGTEDISVGLADIYRGEMKAIAVRVEYISGK